jgi:cell division protein FtsL
MHRAINLALMLATLASAIALYAVKNDTRRLETRVAAQERALERARSDVAVLTAERAHLSRPERLEPLARLIGLSPIAAAQYMRLDPADSSCRASGRHPHLTCRTCACAR